MGLVYQNIEETHYTFEVDNIVFYFSSSFNLRRFKEHCLEFADYEERKLINKFHVEVDMMKYFLITFYKKIEKRGFLIEYKNKKYRDDLILKIEFLK